MEKKHDPILVGSVLSTSYGTGPYRVLWLKWCRCREQLDVLEYPELNTEDINPGYDPFVEFPEPTHPHLHIVCADIGQQPLPSGRGR